MAAMEIAMADSWNKVVSSGASDIAMRKMVDTSGLVSWQPAAAGRQPAAGPLLYYVRERRKDPKIQKVPQTVLELRGSDSFHKT